jgi:hypothetical protein
MVTFDDFEAHGRGKVAFGDGGEAVKPTFADAGQNRHHCRPNVFTITIRV